MSANCVLNPYYADLSNSQQGVACGAPCITNATTQYRQKDKSMRKIDYMFLTAFLVIGVNYFFKSETDHHSGTPAPDSQNTSTHGDNSTVRESNNIVQIEKEMTETHDAIAALRLEIQQLRQKSVETNSLANNSSTELSSGGIEKTNVVGSLSSSAPVLLMEEQLNSESSNVELENWMQEKLISKLDSTVHHNAIENIETQCGSTMCKARFDFSAGNRENVLDTLLQAMPTDNFDIVDDNPNSIIVYLHKNLELNLKNDG